MRRLAICFHALMFVTIPYQTFIEVEWLISSSNWFNNFVVLPSCMLLLFIFPHYHYSVHSWTVVIPEHLSIVSLTHREDFSTHPAVCLWSLYQYVVRSCVVCLYSVNMSCAVDIMAFYHQSGHILHRVKTFVTRLSKNIYFL